ncbi:MAG: hypothetical protein ACTIOD_12745, partial [Enterococcus faecalis]
NLFFFNSFIFVFILYFNWTQPQKENKPTAQGVREQQKQSHSPQRQTTTIYKNFIFYIYILIFKI